MANNCQVPTPPKYVDELLDCIGYTHDLYDKSVLENSCGEGNILKEIVIKILPYTKPIPFSTELRARLKNHIILVLSNIQPLRELFLLGAFYAFLRLFANYKEIHLLKC